MSKPNFTGTIHDFEGRGKRSDVWKHFGFPGTGEDVKKKKTICKLCYTVVPNSGNTTNMTNQL